MKERNGKEIFDEAAFTKAYGELNDAQKKAVDTVEGPVVVVAGPGTGKTQVLTLRIANILRIAGSGIGPENILALTYTTAAVTSLRNRLASLAGARLAHRIGIFTFHSFAEDAIRNYPEYFREFFQSKPVGEVERIQIIENIVKGEKFQFLKTFASDTHFTKAILSAIDTLKQEGLTPDAFQERLKGQEKDIRESDESYYKRNGKNYKKGDLKPEALKPIEKNKELVVVYREYEKALRERKLYDFQDMLLLLIQTLEAYPDFQSALLEQYQYILVDEHQDTNGAQNQILNLLTETPHDEPPNIFTVGDDKQAIYRFQGASVENFLHFQKRFSSTVTIDLTHNYRSTQPILDTAHRLIENDASKKHTALLAKGKQVHDSITVQKCETYQDELSFIAEDCKRKIEKGVEPSEIAIFYRENKALSVIQEALEKKGIPYVVSSKENILQDPVLRKLLLLLRAVANPLDNERLGEALLLDLTDLNTTDVLVLFDEIRYGRKKRFLLQLLKTAPENTALQFENPEKLVSFAQFVEEEKKHGENVPFLEFFENFVRTSGFLEYILQKPDVETHLAQLDSLLTEIRKNIAEKPVYRLKDFLQYIETLLEYDVAIVATPRSARTGVQLMTAHGSKGLEFEYVYITDAVWGRWNNKRRISHFTLPVVTEKTTLDDERRLFYVALTRAKKGLTLTYAEKNTEGKPTERSLFLEELLGSEVEERSFEAPSQQVLFNERKKFLPKLTDPECIHERFFALKLSATALNNYFTSPLLYFFRNLIRLPSPQKKTLLYGNVVHRALEIFFLEAKRNSALPSAEMLLKVFQETLEQEYLLHEYYEEFLERGTKHLQSYYEKRKGEFITHIETEKRLSGILFPLENGEEICLTGIIDKLEYLEDGTVRVVDYKTGKSWSEKTKEEREKLKRQIVFYKLLLDRYQEAGKSFVMSEGVLEFVEANKKGEFEQIRITVSQEDCETLEREIQEFAKDVLNGTFLTKELPNNPETKEFLSLLAVLQGE